jgi:hypothetical protein
LCKRCQDSAPGDHLDFALFAGIGLITVFWLVIAMRSGPRRDSKPVSAFWSAVVVISALGMIHWH